MFPHSDNDIDQFSREAAEQFQPEPTAAGWDALEKKLDKEMPTDQDRRRRRLLWLLLPFLLIGTLSGWWYWNAGKSEPTEPASAGLVEQAPINEANSTSSPKSNGTESSSVQSTSPKSELTEPAATASAQDIARPQTEKTNPTATTSKQAKSAVRATSIVNENRTNKDFVDANETLRPLPRRESASFGITTKNGGRKAKNRITNQNSVLGSTLVTVANDNAALETNYKASLVGNPLALIQRPFRIEPRAITPMFENKKAASPIKIPSKSNFKLGFSVSLVGGFDYSAIHGTKSTNAGFNTGLLFQYDLNKRWSIVSGGIFTKKYYEALPQNFNPPKHYWTTYVTLHYVEGFCEMVDIPVNIRYNAFAKNNTRVYASAGMSSYIMTHQNYDYYYTRAGQYTHKNWDTKSQSNYWFGVANLSAGVEQKIGNKFSVELEPFIKVPVRGVGFGQMDITSYGAMFHLKYQPRFK